MSVQRYIKWSLYLGTLEALHWNDRNESSKYEYTVLKRLNIYISHDRLNSKRSCPRLFSDRRVYDVTTVQLAALPPASTRHSAKVLYIV